MTLVFIAMYIVIAGLLIWWSLKYSNAARFATEHGNEIPHISHVLVWWWLSLGMFTVAGEALSKDRVFAGVIIGLFGIWQFWHGCISLKNLINVRE